MVVHNQIICIQNICVAVKYLCDENLSDRYIFYNQKDNLMNNIDKSFPIDFMFSSYPWFNGFQNTIKQSLFVNTIKKRLYITLHNSTVVLIIVTTRADKMINSFDTKKCSLPLPICIAIINPCRIPKWIKYVKNKMLNNSITK